MSGSEPRRLSTLRKGDRGTVFGIAAGAAAGAERLAAYGLTPGATIVVLQTFPGVVFACDQTELAVERAVADGVLVNVATAASDAAAACA